MFEEMNRLEEYKQTGYYYIPTMTYDLLWSDEIGKWGMSTNAQNCRRCIELDKEDWDLDQLGYEILLGEFLFNPDKYKLEQVRHMNPLELENLRFS